MSLLLLVEMVLLSYPTAIPVIPSSRTIPTSPNPPSQTSMSPRTAKSSTTMVPHPKDDKTVVVSEKHR